jgi:hypothetical protein
MGMAETNSRGIAIGLMRQAMVFLEKAQDWDTAARLQHALDVALAARPSSPAKSSIRKAPRSSRVFRSAAIRPFVGPRGIGNPPPLP